jgi:septum site-determining protein MinC
MNNKNGKVSTEVSKSVKLKGSGKGFKLTLDPSMPEDSIKDELTALFGKLKHLAVNAKVIIDTDGVTGYDHVIKNIKSYLTENFKVGDISESFPENQKSKGTDSSKPWMFHRSDVLMLKGRIRSGQKIESNKHVVIAGDVNPGAEISAGGDVIILGKLKGKVHAGVPDKNDAIIFALEFNPTQIQISDITAVGSDEASGKNAEYACIDKNRIVVQDYLKANPFALIPWPEAL